MYGPNAIFTQFGDPSPLSQICPFDLEKYDDKLKGFYKELQATRDVLGLGVSDLIEQAQSSGLLEYLSEGNFPQLPETRIGKMCRVLMEAPSLPHPLTAFYQFDNSMLDDAVSVN